MANDEAGAFQAHEVMGPSPSPLVFLHIGDIHMTALVRDDDSDRIVDEHPALAAREKQLKADLRAIVADINRIHAPACIDFVYQPGDLAENGLRAEYDAIATILDDLKLKHKLKIVPGDHDRAFGSLDAFEQFRARFIAPNNMAQPVRDSTIKVLKMDPLRQEPRQENEFRTQYYYQDETKNVICLFLDAVSAGDGRKGWGLDFRLGSGQSDWFADILKRRGDKTCAVFMHCYPADFHERDEGTELAGVIWNDSLRPLKARGIDGDFTALEGIRLVEMGHTHYNEIGHDGRTLYATARSPGQNEDGPVGYAVVAIDGAVTSWRFRQVQQTWPFVMITSPADRRLSAVPLERARDGTITVRALVLSDRSLAHDESKFECWCRVDDGRWTKMRHASGCTFETNVDWPDGSRTIQVKALDGRFPGFGKDYIDFDSIEPATCHAADFEPKHFPEKPGSDAFAVGSWPEKGVRGDQLGPNKLGRKW